MINDVHNHRDLNNTILSPKFTSVNDYIYIRQNADIVGLTFVNNNEWMEPQRKNSKAKYSAHPDFLVSNSHSHLYKLQIRRKGGGVLCLSILKNLI